MSKRKCRKGQRFSSKHGCRVPCKSPRRRSKTGQCNEPVGIRGPQWVRTHIKHDGTGRYSVTVLKGVGKRGTEEHPDDDLEDPIVQKDWTWQYDPGLGDAMQEFFEDPTETDTFKFVAWLPAGESLKKSRKTKMVGTPGDENEDWSSEFWDELYKMFK